MVTAIDSDIFAPLFVDEEIGGLFEDQAYLNTMLAVEGALARVEAKLGIIPASMGARISEAAATAVLDPKKIGQDTRRTGVPVMAMVKALRETVGPQAAPYVHWGATTQDIIDTTTVLQLRSAAQIIEKRLRTLIECLGNLVQQYRTTLMAARTHGQQALPVSFGLKAAGWLAPLVRHQKRLDALQGSVLQVQFGGAAGTLALLGENGLSVMKGLAEELDLKIPVMPWHTQRDGFVEFAGWLSMLTASLAKMAQDIILLAQNEVGEVAESAEQDRGTSSTMPQKHNPILSEFIIAAARTNASLLSALHNAMIQEHERATHGWQIEWLTFSQMILLAGGALKNALFLAGHLKVNRARMLENMKRSHYLTLAEAAVRALAAEIPPTEAHALVRKACGIAVAEKRPLIDVVKVLFSETAPGNKIDWKELAKPENYLGQTQNFIDRVLKEVKQLSISNE